MSGRTCLWELLVTFHLRKSLCSHLLSHSAGVPTGEDCLHRGNLKTIPNCCPSACRVEFITRRPAQKRKCSLYQCHKDDTKNSDTWLYRSVSQVRTDRRWRAQAACSNGELWRPTAWEANAAPSLTICIPSFRVFAFLPVKEMIAALTDQGHRGNEKTVPVKESRRMPGT